MRLNPNTIKQIILFGIVGVISLVIDASVTWFLYQVMNVPAGIAAIIGFFASFAFNFPVNRKKVFYHTSSDKYSLQVQIALYTALLLFNAAFTAGATTLLVSWGMNIVLVKVILTATIAVWNFLLFRYVIFSKRSKSV